MSNLNHFILQFVNSKDIREHLHSIGYQFNALEASWLIWQSRNTTLEERHQAWERVIREYPDCPIEERMNTKPQPSLHGFLREYMETGNKYLEKFRNPEGAVYQLRYFFYETESTVEERVYSRFEPEKMNCLFGDDDDLQCIMCSRLSMDGLDEDALGSEFYVNLNRNMNITSIFVHSCIDDEHDREILMDVFPGFWFDFPTPFQRGDILWDPNKPDGFCGGPFVCHSINLHGIADEKKMEYMRENADDSDMTAHGLFVSDQTGVYGEVMSNYMNCEFYRKELVGAQLLLKPFSAYEKGEADAELLLHALHYMRAELEKEHSGLHFYTAEALKKVGIG